MADAADGGARVGPDQQALQAWLDARLTAMDGKLDRLAKMLVAGKGDPGAGMLEAELEEDVQQTLPMGVGTDGSGKSSPPAVTPPRSQRDDRSERSSVARSAPAEPAAPTEPREEGAPAQAVAATEPRKEDAPAEAVAATEPREDDAPARSTASSTSIKSPTQVSDNAGEVGDAAQLTPPHRSSGRPSTSKDKPMKMISEADVSPSKMTAAPSSSNFAPRMSYKESDAGSIERVRSGVWGYCGFVGADWIIHPQAVWYRVWNYFIMGLVVFSTFFTPVRYGFVRSEDGVFLSLDTIVDCIFLIDMILTCNVAVIRKEGLILDRKRIFWAYVCSKRFVIDVSATVPFDLIWAGVLGDDYGGHDDIIYNLLGFLRLLRVNRILELFRELQKSTKFNLLSVVVLKFVLFILLLTHTAGCILYGLARSNDFAEGTWVFEYDPDLPDDTFAAQYMHSLYWAVGTFKAGPAHGSLAPRRSTEMLVACLAMLLNICMNVYLVSSMAALLTTADTRIYAHRGRLHQLGLFIERYSLPEKLKKQLSAYLWFKFTTDQDLEQTVLANFPELYQSRINHVLYASFISNMTLFQGCAPAFLSQLYGVLKPSLYMANQPLVNAGEPSTQLQIIATGEVDMYYQGDWFEIRLSSETITEVPFMCNVDQQFTVKTRALCRILSISRRSWLDACQVNSVDLGLVTANLLNLCRERAAQAEIQSPAEAAYENLAQIVESHIVRLNETNVGALCFAAQRGNIEDMKRLLAVTSAAAADYDQRSPLHLAAASGQMEAVKMLLAKKANINCVDSFGRTPLLEACRAKQHGAAELLFEANAELGFSSKLTLAGQLRDDYCDMESVATGESTGVYDGASAHVEAGELCQAASDPESLWYLRALLKYGANANAHDYDARTALHVACASGNKFAVKLLLTRPELGMDNRDNFGRTPLMEAVRHGHEACARLLHAKGAHHGFAVNTKEHADQNAVHAGGELCQAVFGNQLGYLSCLISYCGLHVDVADYDKRTALMLACAEGNWDAAIRLVQHRADVNRADRWGHTALTEAKASGHPDLAKVLKDMAAQQHKQKVAASSSS